MDALCKTLGAIFRPKALMPWGSDRKHLQEGRENGMLSSFTVMYSLFWLGNRSKKKNVLKNALMPISSVLSCAILMLSELSESVFAFVLLDYSWFVCPVSCSVAFPSRPVPFLENYSCLDSNHTLQVESTIKGVSPHWI